MASGRAVEWTFIVGNTLLGLGAPAGVFAGLPVRYWPVDASSVVLALLLLASAWGLLRRVSWSLQVLRASAWCELSLGLAALAGLLLSIAYLGGVHGTVGRNGLAVLLLGSLLIVPYLIAYPILQLLWVDARVRQGAA